MSEQKTHAEIIAEMRFHGQQNIDAEKDKPEYGILTMEGRITQNYAAELDAAHKREVQNALDAGGFVEASRKTQQVGDAAKLREVCKQFLELLAAPAGFEDGGMDVELDEEQVVMWRNRFREALATPARNCDVGTAEEQRERFTNFCTNNTDPKDIDGWRCDKRCPLYKDHPNCKWEWLHLPYESEVGK